MRSHLTSRLHLIISAAALVLVVSSPWVSLYRALPENPDPLAILHVALGLALLGVVAWYSVLCLRNGGWRLQFPWLTADMRNVVADVAGLFRGRIPAAESGGLFTMLSGLTLLGLLATGLTGIAWLLASGSPSALDWRAAHLLAARAFVVLALLHALSAVLHVLDFLRD